MSAGKTHMLETQQALHEERAEWLRDRGLDESDVRVRYDLNGDQYEYILDEMEMEGEYTTRRVALPERLQGLITNWD